jgi:5-methyltetrahydrofolate--homocysteine methyltransferase
METMQIIDPITGDLIDVTAAPEQIQALKRLAAHVECGEHVAVPDATRAALDTGLPPFDVLINGLQAGLAVVGDRFKRHLAFIPEVLITARAMKTGMTVLAPLLAPTGQKPKGVVVLGTVKGDLHDIGKGIVEIMMEGAGFEVHDCGVNTSPEQFVRKIIDVKADIMGMSALLSTTMTNQKVTVKALEEAGLRDRVKVMSGGAPVTAQFAQEIGADAWAPDALTAVEAAKRLLASDWDGTFVNGSALKRSKAELLAAI